MDNQNLQPQQHTIVSPPEHHSYKLLTMFVGVVMLLIGLGAGYLLFGNKNTNLTTNNQVAQNVPTTAQIVSPTSLIVSQTIDFTTNWKLYRSTKNNFSFRYPPEWTITEGTTRIDVRSKKSVSSLTFYFHDDSDAKGYSNVKVTGKETMQIGSESVIFNEYTSTVTQQPSAYSYVNTLPIIGKTIETVNFYLDSTTQIQDLNIIQKILNSFRSTN